jgi:cyclophilin family peptidyl-prolyl cis-trans isomerase
MAVTQDFMELHDSQRMRTVGTILLRPTSGAAEPEAYEDLVIQSLSELEIGVRYRTARDNLAVRTPEGKVLLSGLDGAHPVAVDMGSENATREVIDHAQQAGAGRPPADPSVAYRVRFTLTTPSLTTAGKKAGISTKVDQLVLEVHPEWAPIAAARFYMLVQQQFFIGSRFYSTIPGFITQFGLPANPQTEVECIFTHTRQRWSVPIPDDPVLQKNTAGRVAFVTTGPNTRTSALFVSLADNSIPGVRQNCEA